MSSFSVSYFPITTEAFHKMYEAGIISENEHVELIRGKIIRKRPKGSKHSNTINRITRCLLIKLQGKAEIHNQNPISIPDDSEPEPDLALLIPPLERYDHRLPQPEDVLLVVEVSDSTLEWDRKEKTRLYAEAGIPVCWVVNIAAREIEVYEKPSAIGYKSMTRFGAGEELPVAALGVRVQVNELLIPL